MRAINHAYFLTHSYHFWESDPKEVKKKEEKSHMHHAVQD